MESGMMRSIRRVTLAVATLTLALAACSNPIDFLAEVADTVMVANDKYLEITAVTPVNNTVNFSPDDPVKIDFDRDLDLASVAEGTIIFDPAIEFSKITFGAGTLTITPAMLVEETDYTITITSGVKGADGSTVRQHYVWSFNTGTAPTGSLKINSDATYTKSTSVTLNVTANGVVTHMRYAQSLVALEGTPYTPVAASVAAYSLTGGDGVNTVYIQFRDSAVPYNESTVKSDDIIQDTVAPALTLNNHPVYINTSTWTSDVSVVETGSGVASYLWTKSSGGSSVTFSSSNTLNTTVTGTADGTLRLRLAATDTAGNTGYLYTSTDPYIIVDITPPSAPVISNPATPDDILPTFTWTGGGGGNGTYRWNFDGASWNELVATSYTATSLSYGAHTFYVAERDVAGNWSTYDSAGYFYFPSFLEPDHTATLVSRTPTFQYASTNPLRYYFSIYVGQSSKGPWELLKRTTAISFTSPVTFGTSQRVYWYYVVESSKPITSPVYYFTTTFLK